MKKNYVKPQAFFESFELSANIATGCGAKTNHARSACKYEVAGRVIFASSLVDICPDGSVWPEDGEYNGICYHNPSEGLNLFTS